MPPKVGDKEGELPHPRGREQIAIENALGSETVELGAMNFVPFT